MARKDEIFRTFLLHEIIQEKSNLSADEIPVSIGQGLVSKSAIVRVIALIVDKLESPSTISETALRNLLTKSLREINT